MIKLLNADCRDVMDECKREASQMGIPIIVTDPPFNIGYHYGSYSDRMKDTEYYGMLLEVFGDTPLVCVHYPEQICRLSVELGKAPSRVVSWVYNSNTARQHRCIAYWGVEPDFRRVTQPYKNPNDKRIKKLIESGKTGSRLYDWWNVNQVKNVSKAKCAHPCQMPLKVMENAIGILPGGGWVVIDPYMGTGTTGIAACKNGMHFIGIEMDNTYYEIAKSRMEAEGYGSYDTPDKAAK